MNETEAARRDRLRAETMARRREILAGLEATEGSKAITLIHRKEPWADEDDHITVEDSEFVLMQIRHTPPGRPIDLILHTPGGLALASEMIALALKGHAARVRVIVPFYAMSGGTLIALAADEVLMEPYSILGPVDPQIAGMPATALLRVVQQKPLHAIDDKTLILADTARLAVQGVKAFVGWLLADRMPAAKAAEVADLLTGGYITHDTPLTMAVAQNLGLNVRPGIPPAVYDLFSTCAFGVCKRPCLAQYDGPGVAPEAPTHRPSWE